jgi:hypothetical protein
MLIGELNSAYLRNTYLRGIDLGTAWMGSAGSAAMDQLLTEFLILAEGFLGVQFCSRRVKTLPDTDVLLGRDYDIDGVVLPYVFPGFTTTHYAVYLPLPDVLSVERVRLWEGDDGGLPPLPVFEIVPLTSIALVQIPGILTVPLTVLVTPTLGQGWAVDYTFGLGQIPVDVAHWVSLHVAIQVLVLAGSGADLSHGLAGKSLTMDGTRQDWTYGEGGSSGMGMYSGPIKVLQELGETIDLAAMRRRYQRRTFPQP